MKSLIHIVLLKTNPAISETEINNILNKLGQLKQKVIPQILEFNCGRNTSPEHLDCGYNYGFYMKFATAEDRNYYLTHPEHIKIATQLKSILSNTEAAVAVVDF